MKTKLDIIHIFKTNIKKIESNTALYSNLDKHAAIEEWSIDCEDVDCVLRIVSEALKPTEIIAIINEFGYECQELP